VTDAPYGVKHGAVRSSRSTSRSPAALLESAMPLWSELLRPGGAIGLSWNTYGLERGELAAMLAASGLEVMDSEPFLGFEHRVDQAIVRDLIVARKPR
jgi:tRNA G10  N-methylase Trm11